MFFVFKLISYIIEEFVLMEKNMLLSEISAHIEDLSKKITDHWRRL